MPYGQQYLPGKNTQGFDQAAYRHAGYGIGRDHPACVMFFGSSHILNTSQFVVLTQLPGLRFYAIP